MNTIVPYITIADLGLVLDECTNRIKFIDDTTRSRILNLVSDYTQQLIRKAEDTKKANILRQNCIRECNNICRETRFALSRQRTAAEADYSSRRTEQRALHEARIASIRSASAERTAQLQKQLDTIRDKMLAAPRDSHERTSLHATLRATSQLVHEEKVALQEALGCEYIKYAETVRAIKARFNSSLEQLNHRIEAAKAARSFTLDMIANATPEQLPGILAELKPQEGGEK